MSDDLDIDAVMVALDDEACVNITRHALRAAKAYTTTKSTKPIEEFAWSLRMMAQLRLNPSPRYVAAVKAARDRSPIVGTELPEDIIRALRAAEKEAP